MKKFILLLCISACFLSEIYASVEYNKIEKAILNSDFRSAKIYAQTAKKSIYLESLNRIIERKATYQDYLIFTSNSDIYGEIEFKKLNDFLSSEIIPPRSNQNVNLSYVKFKQEQITIIRNELKLETANKENEDLKQYLKGIQNKFSKDYERSLLYANIHDIVMLEIQQKTDEGILKSKQNIYKANRLKDTNLILLSKFYYADFLINKGDLEGYINLCKESLTIENQLKEKTSLYESTIEHLLDAYIYKGDFDEVFIEKLLFSLYETPKSKYNSYSFYIKYLGELADSPASQQRIFKLFNVTNLIEFCELAAKATDEKLNPMLRYHLHNESGISLYKNKKYKEAFEYKTSALILIRKIYSQDLAKSIADFNTIEIQKSKELAIQKEKEKNKWYVLIASIVGFFLFVTLVLIVRILKNSKILKIRNAEKEMLLKEIHHRVKNNFQTISSLIELQSKDIEDEKALGRLNEGQSRIKSMSLIHQKLYQKEDISTVDFQEYSEQLLNEIVFMYGFYHVKIQVEVNQIQLDIDTAIPLGLIINELCTNSCKYAFSNEKENEIFIEIKPFDKDKFVLIYQDNGPGLPDNLDLKKIKSLGLRLIQRLTKQLHGTFKYSKEKAAIFEITFKDSSKRKEID